MAPSKPSVQAQQQKPAQEEKKRRSKGGFFGAPASALQDTKRATFLN